MGSCLRRTSRVLSDIAKGGNGAKSEARRHIYSLEGESASPRYGFKRSLALKARQNRRRCVRTRLVTVALFWSVPTPSMMRLQRRAIFIYANLGLRPRGYRYFSA